MRNAEFVKLLTGMRELDHYQRKVLSTALNRQIADKYHDKRNRWVSELDQRRGRNISTVGVANKNSRIPSEPEVL